MWLSRIDATTSLKYIVAFLVLVLVTGPFCYSQGPYVEVTAIKQPSTQSGWATVVTMMVNWRDHQNRSVEEAMKALGDPWNGLFLGNSPLPLPVAKTLFERVGLIAESHQKPSIADWQGLIKSYGPLWVTIGGLTPDITGERVVWKHGLLVFRAGRSEHGANLGVIDPETGEVRHPSPGGFAATFESWLNVTNPKGDFSNLDFEVIHFKKQLNPSK